MRVLFITTFYPPYIIGGWEQLVQEIVEGLQARGHVTHVLTSVYGIDCPTREPGVDRLLTLEAELHHYQPRQFLRYKNRLKTNLTYTEETIKSFNPDVIFIHSMWNLSWGIPWLAEHLCSGRVVYYVADHWPHSSDPHTEYWRDPARNPLLNLAKKVIAPLPLYIVRQDKKSFALQFEHVLCVSRAIKDDLAQHARIDPKAMSVVYNGIDPTRFVPGSRSSTQERQGLSLLYAGSLVWHKGVHTAIEAMSILVNRLHFQDITLTIVGAGHPAYETKLHEIVAQEGLAAFVKFYGRVSREQMPAILQKFDALIFPSVWEEPLARMTQEAMATGLVVIGTLTGGTGELLIEGETGLTFPPENADVLAKKIQQLYGDAELYGRLSANGRNKVLTQFNVVRMIDQMENYLEDVARSSSRQPLAS